MGVPKYTLQPFLANTRAHVMFTKHHSADLAACLHVSIYLPYPLFLPSVLCATHHPPPEKKNAGEPLIRAITPTHTHTRRLCSRGEQVRRDLFLLLFSEHEHEPDLQKTKAPHGLAPASPEGGKEKEKKKKKKKSQPDQTRPDQASPAQFRTRPDPLTAE